MGTVFTKFEKGDENIVNVELVGFSFYKESNCLYCDLAYDVVFGNGSIERLRIHKVNTEIKTDLFALSTDRIRNSIHWNNRLMQFDNYVVDIIKDADPIEVTIEEIEKKFGRKVKIVDKKEDEKDD